MPKLIAVIGAESTGKTTLCAQLARALDGLWVPEYLRDWCMLEKRTPRAEEQIRIAEGQTAREEAALRAAEQTHRKFVFCDTAPVMTALYSELLFKDSWLIAEALMHHKRYALTLFMQADIGWVADGHQRDGAHVQPVVTSMIESYLNESGLRYTKISGEGTARFGAALQALRALR